MFCCESCRLSSGLCTRDRTAPDVCCHKLESKQRGVMLRTRSGRKFELAKWGTMIEGTRRGDDGIAITWKSDESNRIYLGGTLHLPLTIRSKPILSPLVRACVWRLLATCRACLVHAAQFQPSSQNPGIQFNTDYELFCKHFLEGAEGFKVLSSNSRQRHLELLGGSFDRGVQCPHCIMINSKDMMACNDTSLYDDGDDYWR